MKELKEILSHLQTAYDLLKKRYCPKYADIRDMLGIPVNKCYRKCPLHAIIEYHEFMGMDGDEPIVSTREECLESILELAIDTIKEILEERETSGDGCEKMSPLRRCDDDEDP